jgi:hypothetical protein
MYIKMFLFSDLRVLLFLLCGEMYGGVFLYYIYLCACVGVCVVCIILFACVRRGFYLKFWLGLVTCINKYFS